MFDIDQATKDAIRTDLSPEQYKDAIQRLQWCSDLPNLMGQLIHVAKELDRIKKYVFYGKTTPGLRLIESVQIKNPEVLIRLFHGEIGLVTEVGELFENMIGPMFQGTPVDKTNIVEECGDVSWYLRLIAHELGILLSRIIEVNVDKLKTRYPEEFTEEWANNRDLDAERKILEGGSTVTGLVDGEYPEKGL